MESRGGNEVVVHVMDNLGVTLLFAQREREGGEGLVAEGRGEKGEAEKGKEGRRRRTLLMILKSG